MLQCMHVRRGNHTFGSWASGAVAVRGFLSRTIVILSLSILALLAGATAHSVAQGSPARVTSYSAAARVIRLARLGNERARTSASLSPG